MDDDGLIVFDIFRPKEDLPNPGLGDVMLIRQAKVSCLNRTKMLILTVTKGPIIWVWWPISLEYL